MLHQASLMTQKATLSLISLAPKLYRKYALVATTNPLKCLASVDRRIGNKWHLCPERLIRIVRWDSAVRK